GDEIEAVVLSVDAERERISLGIKQLDKDPFSNFLADHPKGSVVRGTIIEVDPKGALVELAESVEGYVRASELSRERVEDARSVLNIGDAIEAKFIGVDRKKRTISLSVREKESDEETAVVQEYSTSSRGGGMTIGDLLKEQMENQGNRG
ncbi:MAG: S1 RNA-binding domain-containing protein, partial [Gammaproteobacteria bacterium]|nr:S1 RNA-binding domain-containing protein [Gammaproteobacteria bacterium]